MLSPKLKKILSGIMIAGDILLGAVFFADLLTGIDPGIDLFLLAFLATDALLSLDYIGRLSKEQKEQNAKAKRDNTGCEAGGLTPEEAEKAVEDYYNRELQGSQGAEGKPEHCA